MDNFFVYNTHSTLSKIDNDTTKITSKSQSEFFIKN